MHNDTRGWILSCASGLACVLGSSIIYTDVIAQKCFGITDFRIAENNTFLCASLSLSAGVMACGQECTVTLHHNDEPAKVVPESELHGTHDHQGPAHHSQEPVSGSTHHEHHDLEAGHPPHHNTIGLVSKTHHHHVPRNPFLTLGMQTSLAISLHKLPEGFITFAANHANPSLGLSVFMSLFIHNICEGLAMALPLYLALQSRFKAMIWACILGGLSQPLGALLAAIWLYDSGNIGGKHQDDSAHGKTALVYGALFSVTSGIMTYVGLQLYTEATSLTHSSAICVRFALTGMVLLGLGQALMR
ncbi:hypothetical protein KEM56_006966 [Ascosphaera pollenicola]|nr:hypothetical protein KEM56_006966 [Ascosphaera pollenicola]